VVAPIGFACDNMEIVHDLDVEAADVAKQNGTHFVRAATVGTTPAFAAMVRQLVQERHDPDGRPRPALGADGAWPDECPPGHCPAPQRKEN
jgi:ferrochelatase